MIDHLRRDLRDAVRSLARRPAFSGVALMSLAIGIGANAAIFTLVNAIVLRKTPIEAPERVVNVYLHQAAFPYSTLSYPELKDLREGAADAFTQIGSSQIIPAQVDGEDERRHTARGGRVGQLLSAAGRQSRARSDAPARGRHRSRRTRGDRARVPLLAAGIRRQRRCRRARAEDRRPLLSSRRRRASRLFGIDHGTDAGVLRARGDGRRADWRLDARRAPESFPLRQGSAARRGAPAAGRVGRRPRCGRAHQGRDSRVGSDGAVHARATLGRAALPSPRPVHPRQRVAAERRRWTRAAARVLQPGELSPRPRARSPSRHRRAACARRIPRHAGARAARRNDAAQRRRRRGRAGVVRVDAPIAGEG